VTALKRGMCVGSCPCAIRGKLISLTGRTKMSKRFTNNAVTAKCGIVLLSLCLVEPALAGERPSSEPEQHAVPGVTATPPPGQVNRYTIPNYTSQATAATRSFVGLTILNNSAVTCNAAVSFQYAFGTTNICVINFSIPAFQSAIYCSRAGHDPLTPCSVSCSPELTFNTGHAYVSSDNVSGCQNIAVDAQQYFTRDTADDLIESQSKLTVTKFNQPNKGD